MIMNRYNQIGKSNAFLSVFGCASMVAVLMRGLAGSRGRWGDISRSRWVTVAHASMIVALMVVGAARVALAACADAVMGAA